MRAASSGRWRHSAGPKGRPRTPPAPFRRPINMELSSHDIGTCKGRYGHRIKRRRRRPKILQRCAGACGQRRLWSCTEKRALVDLASAAGSSVTEVAEAFGVAPSQLYAWRKQMAGGELEADQAMA
ncbi:transposase, partial [Mesorhizobium amorphae]|uniref:transposase n=1 Tax=Mesorhizobium amorphae TaxID=71433 RepID=UPI003137D2A1